MTDNYIIALNVVIDKMTLYVPFVTITLGTIGNLCNILIFTTKQLRQNACSFYFLCSSIFDIFTLLFCAIMRLMVDHYNYLLPNHSLVFCRMRTYLTVVFPAISTCCIMFASIDRCLLTSASARWRNWSQIKIAYRLVAIGIIFWMISSSHMLFLYDFYVINGVSNICSSRPGIYSTFISIYFVICMTLIPYTIMFISSIKTLLHIRALRVRVIPFQQQIARRRIDRHLMFMMFFQVALSMILLSMRTVVIAYQLITRDIPKDSRARVIESFISQFGIVLFYINYAKSFYLYILTSPSFREIFSKRICQCWNYVHNTTRNVPVNQITISGTTKRRLNEY